MLTNSSTKKFLLLATLAAVMLGVLLAPLSDVLAQTTRTITITESGVSNKTSGDSCGWFSWSMSGCLGALASPMMSAAGVVTWLGGVALNQAITITILRMGEFVSGMTALETAWSTIRDLANIFIIFALLTIGVGIILQLSSFGNRELILRLLIIALFLNFSFFITKALIQVGNSVAIMTYGELTAGQQCPPSRSNRADACISDQFMTAMKLPTIYDINGAAQAENFNATQGLSGIKIFIAGILGSVVLLAAGFVFLAGAILLVIRFVVLIFLLALSAAAWAAYVLPATQGLASKWWSALWREIIFAPAFLILLLVALRVAQGASFGNTTSSTDASNLSFAKVLLGGDVASAALFIYYAIILGLIVAAIVISRQLGVHGGGKVTAFGGKLAKNAWGSTRRAAGSATFGAAGALGRQTLGRIGYNAANRDDDGSLKAKVAQGGVRGLIARGQLGAARGLEKSSFDARKVAGLGKELGIGTGKKGFKDNREAAIKKTAAYGKSLGDHAEAYAENVLLSNTIASRTFKFMTGSTVVQEKAAEKLLKSKKEKGKSKELSETIRTIEADIKSKQREMDDNKILAPTGKIIVDSTLESDLRELHRKLDEKKEEQREHSEKIRERKKKEDQEEKESKKEKGKKSGEVEKKDKGTDH